MPAPRDRDVFRRLNGDALKALEEAQRVAAARGSDSIGREHVLLGILRAAPDAFHRLGVPPQALQVLEARLESDLPSSQPRDASVETPISTDATAILLSAAAGATAQRRSEVTSEDVLRAFRQEARGILEPLLREAGASSEAESVMYVERGQTKAVVDLAAQVRKLEQGLEELRAEVRGHKGTPMQTVGTVTAGLPFSKLVGSTVSLGDAPTKGNRRSKLVLIEIADFSCPYCAAHSRDVLPLLEREYISTGKLLYAFQHFPLEHIHPQALAAAVAAECAGRQGRFWDMHDRLFSRTPPSTADSHASVARDLGLSVSEFASCVTGDGPSRVRDDIRRATENGVFATPTFVFGEVNPAGSVRIRRVLTGFQPYPTFKSLIESIGVTEQTQ